MDFKNIHDPAVMQAVAALMSEAVDGGDAGMRALAEAVAPAIALDVKNKNVVPLALTEHNLNPGQSAKYQKREAIDAWYIGNGGQPHRQIIVGTEVEFPVFRIHSNPMIDISDLKNGNLGAITDMQMAASDEIRKKLSAKCITLLSAAVPSANIVDIDSGGGKFLDTAFYSAVGKIEDQELQPRVVFIRGQNMGDLKGWTMDEEGKAEWRKMGVLKRLAGAGLVNSASVSTTEMLILPSAEVGKYAVRTKIAVMPQAKDFNVGFLTWHECAMGITRPDLCFKVTLTS